MTHPAVQPEKVSLYKEADNPYGGSATAEMQHQLRKYRVTNATMAENGEWCPAPFSVCMLHQQLQQVS